MKRDKRWRAKFSGFVSRWKQFLSLKNCRSVRICSVLNRSNRDTTVYYRLIFCEFSWPNMVKWRNSGIINVGYSPAVRSVLGKTVPEILDTRDTWVLKTEGIVFPILTDLGWWITFYFFLQQNERHAKDPNCCNHGRIRHKFLASR